MHGAARVTGFLKRLHVQIVLWVVLPVLILLFLLSLTGIRSHERSMRVLIQERNASLAHLLAGNVAALLNRHAGRFQLVAAATTPSNLAEMRHTLAEDHLPEEEIALALVDNKGHIRAASPMDFTYPVVPPPTRRVTLTFLSHTPYVVWWIPRADGWLVAGIPLHRLELAEAIAQEYQSRAGHVAIMDGYGHLLASTDPNVSPPFEPWSHLFVTVESDTEVFFHSTPQGELVVAAARVPGTNWVLILQESWAALVAPLIQLNRVLPVLLLAAGLTSVMALYFGLRYVAAPLRRLRGMAERIGQGDFAAAARPVGGVEEIEELRRTLDRMAHQVRYYQDTLRMYLRLLTRAQEEERARLARELHDDTIQTLIVINQHLQRTRRLLSQDPEAAARRLETLHQTVAQAMEDLRRFTRALRPLYLEEVGLAPALEMLAREAGASFSLHGTPRRLAPEQELALFRIAQEALNNARRHARATSIRVTVHFHPHHVRVEVADNGVGFRVPSRLGALVERGHLGLMSMYERATSVGARLHIDTAPGRGTRVVVDLPLKNGPLALPEAA